MKLNPFFIASLFLALTACREPRTDAVSALNVRAAEEYLVPVRPGYEWDNQFWNKFARKFTYAPAFDFNEVEGAAGYRFTLTQDSGWAYMWNNPRKALPEFPESAHTDILSWSFTDSSPKASLAPVWNEIPVGYTRLKVLALDSEGDTLATAGERIFLRDFPFKSPYPPAVRDYRDAALRAMHFIHNMPAVRHWLTQREPDMSFRYNSYVCKTMGALISLESRYASMCPAVREEALTIAKNTADFVISLSQPDGAPLEAFPPTYYKDNAAAALEENQGTTMMMEPVFVADGFLDLFEACGDSLYLKQAFRILETYGRIQRADGSFPVKVFLETGEAQSQAGAMLHKLIQLCRRMSSDYGYRGDMCAKAEAWMKDVPMKTFDLTGQFEDVTVLGLESYQNLTNCTAAPYASCLLTSAEVSGSDVKDAETLIRFCEDQFVHWSSLPDNVGFHRIHTPCVYEQYKYRMPVDNSTCNVVNAMLDYYDVTGDELMFAKAKALTDALVNVQNPLNGAIYTTWDFNKSDKNIWINCSYSSIKLLLRFSEMGM